MAEPVFTDTATKLHEVIVRTAPGMQQGIGEGTTKRRRRNPRERVDDVAVTEASGLTLGPDKYPHPLETTGLGELKVTERTLVGVLEELLDQVRWLREGMVLANLIQDLSD